MKLQPHATIRLSVIVVSFNTRELTLKCLELLFADLGNMPAEVWVVDNASHDGSAAAVRDAFPRVRVIENSSNRGFGAANNQAMGLARGQFLMLLNSDAFVSPGTCQRLTEYLETHPAVGLVGPQLVNADRSFQLSCFPFPTPAHAWVDNLGLRRLLAFYPQIAGYRHCSPDAEQPVAWITGACLVLRRELFEQVGGFDERFFMYAEETDWQRRIRVAGWEVVFLPEAQVVHLGQSSDPANADRAGSVNERFFESLDQYQLKHHGMPGAVSVRAAMIFGCSVRWLGWVAIYLLDGRRRPEASRKMNLHANLVRRQLTRRFPSRVARTMPADGDPVPLAASAVSRQP